MGGLSITRYIIFGLVGLFALVVIGVDGHFTATLNANNGNATAAVIPGLGLSSAIFTLITVPVLIFSPRSFISTVMSEVIWLGILCILWIATAGVSTQRYLEVAPSCRVLTFELAVQVCSEVLAIAAISHVEWILLFGYTITLICLACIGRRSWSASVSDRGATSQHEGKRLEII